MKKMIILLVILIIGIVGLAVYGIYLEKKNPTQQKQQIDINKIKQELNQNLQSDETQIANPASQYCEENGGMVEIRETENGQVGICVFPNHKECEEWAFFRKECDYK